MKKPGEGVIVTGRDGNPLTPEQEARRAEVAARQATIQRGVKPPKSGTFGKGVPDNKGKDS